MYKPKPKKSLGQHFFREPELLDYYVSEMGLVQEDVVLEVGPGEGILTALLLNRVHQVVAVEIDGRMIPALRQRWPNPQHFNLIHADIMRYPLDELLAGEDVAHRKVVANIPYYLTSALILKLLNEDQLKQTDVTPATPLFADIFLMVQWEVAERLVAKPGQKSYGMFSLTVQYAAELVSVEWIDRECFFPVPKVDSALVHLRPRVQPPVDLTNPHFFWLLVRSIFQYRRKTLRNVLRQMGYPEPLLNQWATELDLTIRGEQLALAELAVLANHLQANQE